MKEYIVYKKQSYKFIKKIYSFLYNDINWFYLYYIEGGKNFYRIRTTDVVPEIEKYLKEKKIKFSISDYSSLNECGKVIEDYFDDFIPIFHRLSVLMIKGKKRHDEITERVTHLLYNMRGFNYYQEVYDMNKSVLTRMFRLGQEYGKNKYSLSKDSKITI